MEESKYSKSPVIAFIVIGFIFVLFGTTLNISLIKRLFKPPLWLLVFNFFPSIAFFYSAFIINKIARFRKYLIICLGTAVPILFIVMTLLYGCIGWILSARPERNPADYKDVLEVYEYMQRPWLQHFPPSIPENAKNISFYWSKGFLQSSMFIQLRYALPEAEIKTILNESLKKKETAPANLKNINSRLIPLFAGETHMMDWPDDFEIIIFNYGGSGYWKDEGYGTQEYWDKLYTYGIAISQKRNEVVYWVQENSG